MQNPARVDENKLSGISSETKVQLTDGRSFTIREIVNNHIKGKVYTLDYATGKVVPKRITKWYKGPIVHDRYLWTHIIGNGLSKANFTGGGFTNTNKIYVNWGMASQGWKNADKLIPEQDKLISTYESHFNGTFGDFMWGIFAADNIVRRRGDNIAYLKLHFPNTSIQKIFLNKTEKFLPLRSFKNSNGRSFESNGYVELGTFRNEIDKTGYPIIAWLDHHFSDLGLAALFMYDGFLTTRGTLGLKIPYLVKEKQAIPLVIDHFVKATAIEPTYNPDKNCLEFNIRRTISIYDRIAKYMTGNGKDLLARQYHRFAKPYKLHNYPHLKRTSVDVLEVRPASSKQLHNGHVFNLGVAGSNNFFVGAKRNGFLVEAYDPKKYNINVK